MEKHFLYTEIDLYWSPQLRTWPCSPSGTVPFLPCCHTRLDVPAHNRNLPGPLQCQEASLGFLLYSCSAAGFYQQWYPSLGFYLPHKFKVSFNSRCGACRHSYSGTEDNKSNKCSVLSPFYLDLALPAPLKPGAVGTLCWCLHCSRGVKKEEKTRKRGIIQPQGMTWACTAPRWIPAARKQSYETLGLHKPVAFPHTQTRILPQSSSWRQGNGKIKSERKSYYI